MAQLSETFFILLITGGFAFLGLSVRYALRSKCDSVECGCLKVHRNTAEEIADVEEPATPTMRRENVQYATL
jgi:hypothetical protein